MTAVANQQAGRLAQAGALCSQILAREPRNAVALHLLGYVTFEQGDPLKALEMINKAIALKPAYGEAHSSLGNILDSLARREEAIASFRAALKINPKLVEAHYNLANCLSDHGAVEAAVETFERVLALRPEYAEAYNNMGNALKGLGRLAEAEAAFRKALSLKPDYARAHFSLSSVKSYRPGDDHMAAMEALLHKPTVDPMDAIHLHFALGKAHEESEEYDRAFENLLAGNRRMRDACPFDIAEQEDEFNRIAEAFDEAFLSRRQATGAESGLPVFIVGMPRSGTSLVEQILASHGKVHGAGERGFLPKLVNGLGGGRASFPECLGDAGDGLWKDIGDLYLESLTSLAPEALRITDKMPINFKYIGLIHLCLPHARIIHCRRDAVDTCLSCFKVRFSHGQEFSYDLAELGRYYRFYERLMDHWQAVLPGKLLDLPYEGVVDDLEGAARRMIEFCGLDWDENCLEFHNTDRTVMTASNVQVRRPIYNNSIGLWRRYERQLAPLLDALGRS